VLWSGDGSQVNFGKIEIEEMVEERFATTVVHLLKDGREVGMILLLFLSNVEDAKAAFVKTSGNVPLAVAAYQQANVVVHRDRIDSLELNEMLSR
jgi:hypothetical protein